MEDVAIALNITHAISSLERKEETVASVICILTTEPPKDVRQASNTNSDTEGLKSSFLDLTV